MEIMNITKKDYILLTALRTNARQTLTQISKKTRIPISTLHERLKSQEKNIIHRFATILDFTKLGFHTKVHFQIKTTPEQKARLQSYLELHEQVNCLYKIANDFDFFVEAVFEHVADVEEFIEILQEKFSIQDYNTQFISKDIKRESFLASSC